MNINDIVKERLGIAVPNAMQIATWASDARHLVLLSPTGSGKTIAFAGALLKRLDVARNYPQAVILAPSRELVLQIHEVVRRLATGYKVSAFYGKHSVADEVDTLAIAPDIIVATPGRLLDHIRRDRVDVAGVRTLVIDEYDKCLELGFHDEMKRICAPMRRVENVILTSATPISEMPEFIDMNGEEVIDYSDNGSPRARMQIARVESPARDKLQTLVDLLRSMPNGKVIVFVNHRESAERVYEALRKERIPVDLYHGGLEQLDRDSAIVKFNNGSTPVLVATDLGSRGLDIEAVNSVVHYHLPGSPEAWVHRNGRTARVDAEGQVYVITSEADNIPDYVVWDRDYNPTGHSDDPLKANMATVYINAGRKEKISKGDIVGFLTKDGGLEGSQIGRIDLRDHCAYVAVPKAMLNVIYGIPQPKIKGKRVKLSKFQS